MKPRLITCLIFLTAAAALGKWASVSLEDLLKKTDLIVVARLTNVQEKTEKEINYGSGTLTVIEVIRGDAKASDKLRLEWANRSALVCPRVENAQHKDKTLIWLLQKGTNGVFTANYPGRVLESKRRGELDEALKK